MTSPELNKPVRSPCEAALDIAVKALTSIRDQSLSAGDPRLYAKVTLETIKALCPEAVR